MTAREVSIARSIPAAAYAGTHTMTAPARTEAPRASTVNTPARCTEVTADESRTVPGVRAPDSASTSSPVPPGSDTNAPVGDAAIFV